MVIPEFDCEIDAYWWVLCTEKYFKRWDIPETQKMAVAAIAMKGPALTWWLRWYPRHLWMNWDEFTAVFLWKFKPEWRVILPVPNDEEEPEFHAQPLAQGGSADAESTVAEEKIRDLNEPAFISAFQSAADVYPSDSGEYYPSTEQVAPLVINDDVLIVSDEILPTIAPIEVSGCVEEQIDASGSSMIALEDSIPFTNLMDTIVVRDEDSVSHQTAFLFLPKQIEVPGYMKRNPTTVVFPDYNVVEDSSFIAEVLEQRVVYDDLVAKYPVATPPPKPPDQSVQNMTVGFHSKWYRTMPRPPPHPPDANHGAEDSILSLSCLEMAVCPPSVWKNVCINDSIVTVNNVSKSAPEASPITDTMKSFTWSNISVDQIKPLSMESTKAHSSFNESVEQLATFESFLETCGPTEKMEVTLTRSCLALVNVQKIEQIRELTGYSGEPLENVVDGGTKRNQGLSLKSKFPFTLKFNGFGKSRERIRATVINLDDFLGESMVVLVSIYGNLDVDITGIQHDSRLIPPIDLFVCCVTKILGTCDITNTMYLIQSVHEMAHSIANYVNRENKLDTPYKTLSTLACINNVYKETCHCDSETTSVHGENSCKLSMLILHEVDVLFRQLCASLSSLKDILFSLTNCCNNLNLVYGLSAAFNWVHTMVGKGLDPNVVNYTSCRNIPSDMSNIDLYYVSFCSSAGIGSNHNIHTFTPLITCQSFGARLGTGPALGMVTYKGIGLKTVESTASECHRSWLGCQKMTVTEREERIPVEHLFRS